MKKSKIILGVGLTLIIITFALTSVTSAKFEDWNINWKQCAGESVTVALVKHPLVDALVPHIGEFEKLTGIKVDIEVLSEIGQREKLLVDLASHAGIYDVFMTGPRYGWKYYKAGWIEPLERYLQDPTLTDFTNYDYEDFFPQIIRSDWWTGEIGKGLGKGHLLLLPVQHEGEGCLYYRKDILAKAGMTVPTTWDQLYEEAVKLTGRVFNNTKVYGYVGRGHRDDSTFVTWIATILYTFGGKIFDEDLNCIVNNSDGVRAFEYAAKLMRDAGPPGATAFTWYEVVDGYAMGKYVFNIDSDQRAVYYESPTTSVMGKIGYVPTPPEKAGRQTGQWTWGLSISRFSTRREAAWLFIEWATSKEMMLETMLAGGMDPPRKSIWNAPEIVEKTKKWGCRDMKNTVLTYCKTLYPPLPNMVEIADRLTRSFQEIYLKKKTSKDAMNSAADDINDMMRTLKR